MEAIILRLGAIAGAIAAIISIIKFIAIPIKKYFEAERKHRELVETSLKNYEEALKQYEEHNKENYIAILQLKIMDPHMPLEERVSAGYIYTEVLNRDGPVHLQYELLQDNYKQQFGERFKGDVSL